jgi:hypothetical protein
MTVKDYVRENFEKTCIVSLAYGNFFNVKDMHGDCEAWDWTVTEVKDKGEETWLIVTE